MDTKNPPDQAVVAVPPEPATETQVTAPAEAPAAQNLTMDVVAAPASAEETENTDKDGAGAPAKDTPKPDDKPKAEKPPKTPGDNGVTIAITVAVVAVLVLSVLAVFAYMSGTK